MGEIKYSYIAPHDDVTRHIWTAIGDNSGVHVWAEPHSEKFYGGVEVHSKTRLYDFGDGKPDNDDCWLLGCPCWHDGSSLYFSERIEPFIRHAEQPFGSHINEYMNAIMYDWYQSRFKAEECEPARQSATTVPQGGKTYE
jgi:hypothetical protein